MAGESTLVTFTSDVAEAASAEYLLTLANRDALPNHPALFYAGKINDTLSNVIKIPHYAIAGATRPAQTPDAQAVGYTAISDSSTNITVALHRKVHAPGDIAKMAVGRILNPQVLGVDGAIANSMQLTKLIATAVGSFSATAGPGTGVDADVPTLLAAIGRMFTLNVDTSGGFMGILHGQQWSDILVDFSAVGGAIPFISGTEAMMTLRGGSYRGLWLGVDWFSNNEVQSANAGADYAGGIFAKGGIVWGDGEFAIEEPGAQIALGRNGMFERGRNVTTGVTEYATSFAAGVSKALEAGVSYISDL